MSGNYSGTKGGGIGNVLYSATLINSIVAGNAARDGNPDIFNGGIFSNSVTSSIVGQYSGSPALTDVFANVAANPHTGVMSGALADNGGPVETIALKQAGAAVNAGSNALLPADAYDLDHDGNPDSHMGRG